MLSNNYTSEAMDSVTPSSPSSAIASNIPNEQQQERSLSDLRSANDRLWRMRWWFFALSILLSIIWMVGMIMLSIHVFDVSRYPPSLLISAIGLLPFVVIRRFADFLLPMDDKRFELEKMKIQKGYRTWRQWPQHSKK